MLSRSTEENSTMAGWKKGVGSFTNFTLESGAVLPKVEIAYVMQGAMNQDQSNVVLVLHGYTSSHEFVCPRSGDSAEGSWADLIGPGRAIDTNRYCVIAPNALGSCYGSTGPASPDPRTGRPYGPEFPDISFHDMVASQHQMLQSLGVNKLAAVVGVSMGGFAAWQWGVQYPQQVGALAVVLSSLHGKGVVPDGPGSSLYRLQGDPHWNKGWVYDDKAIQPALQDLRRRTLMAYRSDTDTQDGLSQIEDQARRWANEHDPNSLVVLGKAIRGFDVTPQLHQLVAPVFLMLATTDRLFPASNAQETLSALRQHRVSCRYLELDTIHGHQSSGKEWHRWAQPLQEFLNSVAPV